MYTKPSGGILGPAIDRISKRQAIVDALLVDANGRCAKDRPAQEPDETKDSDGTNESI